MVESLPAPPSLAEIFAQDSYSPSSWSSIIQLLESAPESEHCAQTVVKLIRSGAGPAELMCLSPVLALRPSSEISAVINELKAAHVTDGLFTLVSVLRCVHPVPQSVHELCVRVLKEHPLCQDAYFSLLSTLPTRSSAALDYLYLIRDGFARAAAQSRTEQSLQELLSIIHGLRQQPHWSRFLLATCFDLGGLKAPCGQQDWILLFDSLLAVSLWDSQPRSDTNREQSIIIFTAMTDFLQGIQEMRRCFSFIAEYYSSAQLIDLSEALLRSVTPDMIASGAELLRLVASQSHVQEIKQKAVGSLMAAAIRFSGKFCEHRMSCATSALIDISNLSPSALSSDHLPLLLQLFDEEIACSKPPETTAALDIRVSLFRTRLWSHLLSVCSDQGSNMQAEILQVLQRCSPSPDSLQAVAPWKALATCLLASDALKHIGTGKSDDISAIMRFLENAPASLPQGAVALVALLDTPYHITKEAFIKRFVESHFMEAKARPPKLGWMDLVICAAKDVSVLTTDLLYRADFLCAAALVARLTGVREQTAEADVIPILEDVELEMSKLKRAWLWTLAAVVFGSPLFDSGQVGGPSWDIFARILRRASRYSSSLNSSELNHTLALREVNAALAACFSPALTAASLQYLLVVAGNQGESSEYEFDRAHLADWLLFHVTEHMRWALRGTGIEPRSAYVPLFGLTASCRSIAAGLHLRYHPHLVEAERLWHKINESNLLAIGLATVSCFSKTISKISQVVGASRTAEQSRFIQCCRSLSTACLVMLKSVGDFCKKQGCGPLVDLDADKVRLRCPSYADECVPDLKLELFRLFWNCSDSKIRAAIAMSIDQVTVLQPFEYGAICVWFLRNCRLPSDDIDGFHPDILMRDYSFSRAKNQQNDPPRAELILLQDAVTVLRSYPDAALAFLHDFIHAIETSVDDQLHGHSAHCRYRAFTPTLLPIFSHGLAELCRALWDLPLTELVDLSETYIVDLINCSWRLFCLMLLALSDPELPNNLFDVRTLRTRFLKPVLQRMHKILESIEHKATEDAVIEASFFVFTAICFSDEMLKMEEDSRVFRIPKKSQSNDYKKLADNVRKDLLQLVWHMHDQLLLPEAGKAQFAEFAESIIQKLVWVDTQPNDDPDAIAGGMSELPWLACSIPAQEDGLKYLRHFVNLGLMSIRGEEVLSDNSELDYSVEESERGDDSLSVDIEFDSAKNPIDENEFYASAVLDANPDTVLNDSPPVHRRPPKIIRFEDNQPDSYL